MDRLVDRNYREVAVAGTLDLDASVAPVRSSVAGEVVDRLEQGSLEGRDLAEGNLAGPRNLGSWAVADHMAAEAGNRLVEDNHPVEDSLLVVVVAILGSGEAVLVHRVAGCRSLVVDAMLILKSARSFVTQV